MTIKGNNPTPPPPTVPTARPEDPRSESWANFELVKTEFKSRGAKLYGLDAYCGLNARRTHK